MRLALFLEVPDVDLAAAAGDEPRAIGREGHAPLNLVVLQLGHFAGAVQVPDANAVTVTNRDMAAIGRDGCGLSGCPRTRKLPLPRDFASCEIDEEQRCAVGGKRCAAVLGEVARLDRSLESGKYGEFLAAINLPVA